MDKKKNLYLMLLGVALFAIVLLAISLPDFQLREGQPFPLDTNYSIPVMGTDVVLPGGNVIYWIIRGMSALVIIGLPIYIIVSLFSPEGRRRLLVQTIILVVMVFLLDRLAQTLKEKPQEEQVQSEISVQEPLAGEPGSSQAEQFEAVTPDWMVWISSLGVAVFLTGLVVLGFWLYYRRFVRKSSSLNQLAKEAERAANALQEGGDFKNIIIRCYYQMSQILYAERGIRRDLAMTPSEFEQALEEKGLPAEPIQYLTSIFEDVRYGTKQPAKREEDKAIWYLTVIAEASKKSQSPV